MKTWGDWSDSEITIAVNSVTKKYHDVEIKKPGGDNDWIGDYAGTRVNREVVLGWKGEGADEEVFSIDYCNSWLDMGPLIVENGIELSPLFRGDWCASYIKKYTYEEDPVYGIQCAHKSPLRAAAIVFLEVNGVKP